MAPPALGEMRASRRTCGNGDYRESACRCLCVRAGVFVVVVTWRPGGGWRALRAGRLPLLWVGVTVVAGMWRKSASGPPVRPVPDSTTLSHVAFVCAD